VPSGRRRSPRDLDLTFFVDRGLGRRLVPEVFREAGHGVVLMAELYPDDADQLTGDDRWIGDVSARGWAARYRTNLHRIVQRCRKPGPYVDVVHRDRIERRWP
jgi:PIN like domain